MIRLTDTEGYRFVLKVNTCADGIYFAYKKDIRRGLRDEDYMVQLYVRNTRKLSISLIRVSRPTFGILKLGCHTFSRKNSTIIRQWAKGN